MFAGYVRRIFRGTVAPRVPGAWLACVVVMATLIGATTNSVRAQTSTWTGATDNTYSQTGNWNNGIPPANNSQGAVFNDTGAGAGNTNINVDVSLTVKSWLFSESTSYSLAGSDVIFDGLSSGVSNTSSAAISIANNFGGSGATVVQNGGGTLTLSGNNTYSGGTTISSGTLQVGTASVFNVPGDPTSGIVSSAVGTGVITLDGGVLQAGVDVSLGNATVINTTGGTIDANGWAITMAGNITDGNGKGALSVVDTFGGGNVILTGTNTYTGGTTICSCGSLQLGDDTHKGSIVGAVRNDGFFSLYNANTAGITSINNFGLVEFLNTTSASTMTITNRSGAETDFYGNSNGGSATIINRNSGLTTFNNSSNALNANITNMSGGFTVFLDNSSAGNSTITNNSSGGFFLPGGLVFYDNSNAGTATIINNGVVAFGQPFFTDTPSAGNANITNNSGSELDFNAASTAENATITTNSGAATYFYDNSTGGNARLITNGTGVTDFSGTIGRNGDGRISAGSIEGSGTYYIGAGNVLAVGSNNLSTTVSGRIADFNPCGCYGPGSGALLKVGTGTLTLSGTNTYTGTTTVNAGTLQVDGSIASSSLTSVNSTGLLSGIGTVGNTQVNSGGIFAPGAAGAPGTSMKVSGNLAFQSGAIYLVQINSASATKAIVTGTATLGGNVLAAFAPGSNVVRQYTILQSAGLGGTTFAGLGTANISGFAASLSYTNTDVLLNLTATLGVGAGLNRNQSNVVNAINSFFNSGGTLTPNFLTIFGLNGGNLGSALSQLSGEAAASGEFGAFQMMTSFLGLMLDPSIEGRSNPTAGPGANGFAPEKTAGLPADVARAYASVLRPAASPSFEQRWSAWGSAFGGYSTLSGNAAIGSQDTTASAYGFAGGLDYLVSPHITLGVSFASGATNWGLAQGLGGGRSDAFQAGVYGTWRSGPAYLAAAVAVANHWMTTDRTAFAGDHLTARFDAQNIGGRIEAGYRYSLQGFGIAPYLALQTQTFHTPGYSETDLTGGGFGLSYVSREASDTRSEIGARFDRTTMLIGMPLTLRGRAAWAHDWVANPPLTATFQALSGAAFTVSGVALPSDSALLSAGAELSLTPVITFAPKFEGAFAANSQSYAGTGTIRYVW